MNRDKIILIALQCVLSASLWAGHGLRYTAPAEDSSKGWEERSLPVGCGHFGANVFGIATNERVQVTYNALHNRDPRNPKKANLTDALEIRLRTDHGAVSDYSRGLDLDTAVAWVEYAAEGVRYRREFFASYPSKVLVMRLTASEKGRLAFAVDPVAPFLRKGRRTAERTAKDGVVGVYQELSDFAIRFDSELKVVTDGKVSSDGLAVTEATEATIIAAFASNYRLSPKVFAEPDFAKKLAPIDPRPEARRILAAAVRKGFAALRDEHVRDYAALYGRVAIDLGGDAADAAVPTDELLARYRKGERSRSLEETYVQYGRYLLISSSRPGTLPANLQGVWNCHEFSPWGSGYWHNINVQMNYWPAFSGNLAECFEAYADFNEAARPTKMWDCYGFIREHAPENLPNENEPLPDFWCLGTANYPYVALGGPGGHDGPGIGGLTTRLFTDWWEFTQDRDILAKRAFPALRGMADFLTRCVRNYDGKCLAVFSASPEQIVRGKRFSWTDEKIGQTYYHTIGCAFDQQLLWQNAHDLIRMADALGTNDAVIAKCREQIGRYDPVVIGASGQIKEYREENAYGEIGDPHHRHISHLMGLMPGTLITRETPEWMAAAKRTLELRGDHSTGWALAHRLNAWARTGDGEHAYALFNNLLGERTYDNLWDAHPPFQIDGNFGGTAGVIEMLLQSHAGFIDLLPALPSAWAKKGSFRGLRARGAFEVDCDWADGKPVRVAVHSLSGLKPDVRFNGKPVAQDVLAVTAPSPREVAARFQAEIDAVAAKGGGRVTVPPGEWTSGTLWLRNGVELHLAEGAVLKASGDLADYNAEDAYPQNWSCLDEHWRGHHLIIAHEVENAAVTGPGTIDGNGRAFFAKTPGGFGKIGWRRGSINTADAAHARRPGQLVVFIESRNVRMEGVKLVDSPCWTCFFHGCDNVRVRGLMIRSDLRHQNTDGVDIDSCRDVLVADCDVETGDDCFTVRGSNARLKAKDKACENVRFENCRGACSACGVRVGVGNGTIRDVAFSNLVFTTAGRGLALQCCYSGKGQKGVDISNVRFSDVTVRDAAIGVLVTGGAGEPWARLEDVTFERLDIEAHQPVEVRAAGRTIPDRIVFSDFRSVVKDSPGAPARVREFFVAEGVGRVTVNGRKGK